MPLANMFVRRTRPPGGPADRLPGRLDDLRGPARGVIQLPRHLAWPGMRECDVSDDPSRRGVYAMLLAQGTPAEIIRLVNAELLREDWPLISETADPGVRFRWQRLLKPEPDIAGESAAPSGSAPDANPVALT